ncbi:hypothetical protein Tco_1440931 [Tanacetum coccineum]
MALAINALRDQINVTLLKDRKRGWMFDRQNSLREFYKTDVILMSVSLLKTLKELKQELMKEVQEMLNIFESMEQKNKKKSCQNILAISQISYLILWVSSVVDYEEDYHGELQGDSQEDKLTTAMMLLAQAITQKFSMMGFLYPN